MVRFFLVGRDVEKLVCLFFLNVLNKNVEQVLLKLIKLLVKWS
jgi:hypothetical protein